MANGDGHFERNKFLYLLSTVLALFVSSGWYAAHVGNSTMLSFSLDKAGMVLGAILTFVTVYNKTSNGNGNGGSTPPDASSH